MALIRELDSNFHLCIAYGIVVRGVLWLLFVGGWWCGVRQTEIANYLFIDCSYAPCECVLVSDTNVWKYFKLFVFIHYLTLNEQEQQTYICTNIYRFLK